MLRRFVFFMYLAVATCCFAHAGETKQESFASLMPEDTTIFFESRSSGEGIDDWHKTAFGKMMAEPAVKEFLKTPMAELDKYIKQAEMMTGIKFQTIQNCFGDQIALGVVLKVQKQQIAVKLVGRCASPDDVKNLLKAIPVAAKRLNPGIPAEAFNLTDEGATLSFMPGPGASFKLALDNGLFVISLSFGKNNPAGLLQSANKLSDATGYKKALEQLGNDQMFFEYYDVAYLMDFLKMMAENNRKIRDVTKVISALELNKIRSIVFSTTPKGEDWMTGIWVESPAPHTGFLSLCTEGKIGKKLLSAVPAGAVTFSVSKFDLGNIMNVVRGAIKKGGGDTTNIDGAMAEALKKGGFHPEQDLLNQFGDEMLLVSLPTDKIGGIPLMGLNGICLVVKVKDETKISETAKIITKHIYHFVAQNPFGAELFEKQLPGANLGGFNLANAIVPSWTVKDGYMLMALSPQAIEMVAASMDGKIPNIMSNDDFKSRLKLVMTKGTNGIGYSTKPEIHPGKNGLQGMMMISSMAGIMLPALKQAHTSARIAAASNNLRQIGLGITMFSGQNNRMPKDLSELYNDGQGLVSNPRTFVSPVTGMGFQYVQGLKPNAPANAIVAFEAGGTGKRSVLFMDCHVTQYSELEFQQLLRNNFETLARLGFKVTILPPYAPGSKVNFDAKDDEADVFMKGPAIDMMGPGDREIIEIVKKILMTFPLYKLPPADCFNRHTKSMASVSFITPDGFGAKMVSSLPAGFDQLIGSQAPGMSGSGGVAAIAIIAAIAVPNLIESRLQANETNAVAALKQYANAQATFKKANYAGVTANGLTPKQYCPDFSRLGGPNAYVNGAGNPIELIPAVFSMATNPGMGYQGYYFVNVKKEGFNFQHDFTLYAVPCVYEKTGINTYVIDGKGTVYMKDLGPEGLTPGVEKDATWIVP